MIPLEFGHITKKQRVIRLQQGEAITLQESNLAMENQPDFQCSSIKKQLMFRFNRSKTLIIPRVHGFQADFRLQVLSKKPLDIPQDKRPVLLVPIAQNVVRHVLRFTHILQHQVPAAVILHFANC